MWKLHTPIYTKIVEVVSITSLVVPCSSSYSCSCSWSCCWIVWSLTKSLSLSLKTLNYHSRRFICDSTCSTVHCSDLITSRSYSCFCSTTFCNCFAWISMDHGALLSVQPQHHRHWLLVCGGRCPLLLLNLQARRIESLSLRLHHLLQTLHRTRSRRFFVIWEEWRHKRKINRSLRMLKMRNVTQ